MWHMWKGLLWPAVVYALMLAWMAFVALLHLSAWLGFGVVCLLGVLFLLLLPRDC